MIYDKVYAQDKEYNYQDDEKIKLVYDWAKSFDELLDVGCGRGHYLKFLASKGLDVTGLEPSKYLCDHDLIDQKVINSDILGVEGRWEALYCMDVLEHIEPSRIELTVKKLARLAPFALLGIANHSDVWEGTELHLIRESKEWWERLLSQSYKLNCIHETENYFVFTAQST